MADLTYAQLKRVWLDAAQGTNYNSNTWASLMAAIAEAESSGDPNATNPTDNGGTQTSWGLWQISNGTHSPVSSNWANPVVNAQLAIQKLQSQGLGAWGTYNSGAYKAYLSDGTTPSSTVPGTGGAPGQATAELTAAQQASSVAAQTECALGFDQHIGIFFGHGPNVQFCVISKTQVRAVMGGVYIVAGGLTVLVGVVLAAIVVVPGLSSGKLVRALERTPAAGKQIGKAVNRTPKAGQARVPAPRPAPAGERSTVGRAPGEPFRYATPQGS